MLPYSLGGHQTDILTNFSVGYSQVLYGLFMAFCLMGESHVVTQGIRIPKVAIPFVYLIIT